MERIFHNLSKETRINMLLILLERRSKKELAQDLGVSPALITKYINRVTHPSDRIIKKAYLTATEDERERIDEILLNDLTSSLMDFLENVEISHLKENIDLKKLKEKLNEIQTADLLGSLSLVERA